MVKKTTIFLLSISLLGLGISTPVLAKKNKVIEKIIRIGKIDNRTMQHLDTLCHRFGGRPIGTAAYDNAAEWAVHMFKSWGMKVQLQEAGSLPVGFNRGPWFGKMISPDTMQLHFRTPAYTPGTRGRQVAAAVIEPRTERAFSRRLGKLKGAWVLMNRTDADKKRAAEIRKLGYWERRKQQEIERKKLDQRIQKMEKAGALGFIMPAKLPIQSHYDRNLFKWKGWNDIPKICRVNLDEHQFEKIFRRIRERQRVLLEIEIRNFFKMGPVKYHNVIGIIPGTKYPDEYVIFGGHLDSYDAATGAVDNGNGVTTSMEAARLIMAAGGKPKRTILVCLWAGEEFGLLGSQAWVKKNKKRLKNISVMFNRDGGPTAPESLSVSEAMWKDMEKVCQPVTRINPGFPFRLVKHKARRIPKTLGGSDSVSFMMHGVPAMSFRNGDPKGYGFSYYEIWHTENDYYQKSIKEYQDHASIVTAVVIYGIANLNHKLDRTGFYLPEKK